MLVPCIASFSGGAAVGFALLAFASATVAPLPEPRDPRVHYADDVAYYRPTIDPNVGPGSLHRALDYYTPPRPVRVIPTPADTARQGKPATLCPVGYTGAGNGWECIWEGRK